MQIEFKLLGSPRIVLDGEAIEPTSSRPRNLLAALLMQSNRPLSMERLADSVWENPPDSWRANLRKQIAGLRRDMGPVAKDRLISPPGGYQLRVREGELDVDEFQRLRVSGMAEIARGHHQAGVLLLERALTLWQGSLANGVTWTQSLEAQMIALEQDRLHVFETLTEMKLRMGERQSLIGQLRSFLVEYPTREGLWGQLMRATYLAGDAATALAAFDQARSALVNGLGIDPGPELRTIQRAVLSRDDVSLLSYSR